MQSRAHARGRHHSSPPTAPQATPLATAHRSPRVNPCTARHTPDSRALFCFCSQWRYVAEYVTGDEALDFAVLRLVGSAQHDKDALPHELLGSGGELLMAFTIGNSDHVHELQDIFVEGYGKVSAGQRDQSQPVKGNVQLIDLRPHNPRFGTTATLFDGHSGGPVLDSMGRVIGWAVSSTYDWQTLTFEGKQGNFPVGGLHCVRPINAAKDMMRLAKMTVGLGQISTGEELLVISPMPHRRSAEEVAKEAAQAASAAEQMSMKAELEAAKAKAEEAAKASELMKMQMEMARREIRQEMQMEMQAQVKKEIADMVAKTDAAHALVHLALTNAKSKCQARLSGSVSSAHSTTHYSARRTRHSAASARHAESAPSSREASKPPSRTTSPKQHRRTSSSGTPALPIKPVVVKSPKTGGGNKQRAPANALSYRSFATVLPPSLVPVLPRGRPLDKSVVDDLVRSPSFSSSSSPSQSSSQDDFEIKRSIDLDASFRAAVADDHEAEECEGRCSGFASLALLVKEPPIQPDADSPNSTMVDCPSRGGSPQPRVSPAPCVSPAAWR